MGTELKRWFVTLGFWGLGIALLIIIGSLALGSCGGVAYQPDLEEGFLYPAAWETSDVPLHVVCSGYTEETDSQCRYVYDAMDRWNQRIGNDVFSRTRPDEAFQVNVMMGVPSFRQVRMEIISQITNNNFDFRVDRFIESNDLGFAVLRHSGGFFHDCHIGISANIQNSEMLWNATVHELGHCLNLAHDEYRSSIMYWRLEPSTGFGWPPRISDYDRSIIRVHYFE